VQGLSVGGRVGAELVRQCGPQPLVGGEGRSRLPGPEVGEHRRPVGRLVERVGAQRRLGVRQRAALVADRQRGPPGRLPGMHGQALGRAPGRLRPVGIRLLGQDRSPPQQVEGALGGGQGERGLAGQPTLRLGDQPLGVVQVDGQPRTGHEPPAVAAAGDRVRPEHGPQPADQRGQVGVGIGRWPVAPEGLGEHLGRDDPAAPCQQQLQQRASLAAGQLVGGDGHAVAAHHERAEHLDGERDRVGHAGIVGDQRSGRNRPAQRFQLSASSGTSSSRDAWAWSPW
jgi:hypothetical protein